MAAAPKDADVRSTIRGILISTPKEMRLHQLNKDFLEMEGQHIPYAKFGFRNLLEYLHSIPDTVSIMDSSSNPVILPVTSERSSHVEKLVLRQKINPPKRGGFHQVPSRRSLNHVSPNSCKRTRSRKKGLVSRMPESRPHANANEKGESLHRSSDKTDNTKKNNSNPFQNRPTIDIKCLQEQINEFQKYNCSTYKNNDIQNKKPYQCQKDTVKKGPINGGRQTSADCSLQKTTKNKKKTNIDIEKKRNRAAFKKLTVGVDDSSVFSLTVAAKLRRMPHYQRHLAEMLINKVLYYGNSETLTSFSDVFDSYRYRYSYYNRNTYYNNYNYY